VNFPELVGWPCHDEVWNPSAGSYADGLRFSVHDPVRTQVGEAVWSVVWRTTGQAIWNHGDCQEEFTREFR